MSSEDFTYRQIAKKCGPSDAVASAVRITSSLCDIALQGAVILFQR